MVVTGLARKQSGDLNRRGALWLILSLLSSISITAHSGQNVIVADERALYAALTDSSVSHILLYQSIQLQPSFWNETTIVNISRDVTVEGSNGDWAYLVELDFSFIQLKVVLFDHVSFTFRRLTLLNMFTGFEQSRGFFAASPPSSTVAWAQVTNQLLLCMPFNVTIAAWLAAPRPPDLAGRQQQNLSLINETFCSHTLGQCFSPVVRGMDWATNGSSGYRLVWSDVVIVCHGVVSQECIDDLGADLCYTSSLQTLLAQHREQQQQQQQQIITQQQQATNVAAGSGLKAETRVGIIAGVAGAGVTAVAAVLWLFVRSLIRRCRAQRGADTGSFTEDEHCQASCTVGAAVLRGLRRPAAFAVGDGTHEKGPSITSSLMTTSRRAPWLYSDIALENAAEPATAARAAAMPTVTITTADAAAYSSHAAVAGILAAAANTTGAPMRCTYSSRSRSSAMRHVSYTSSTMAPACGAPSAADCGDSSPSRQHAIHSNASVGHGQQALVAAACGSNSNNNLGPSLLKIFRSLMPGLSRSDSNGSLAPPPAAAVAVTPSAAQLAVLGSMSSAAAAAHAALQQVSSRGGDASSSARAASAAAAAAGTAGESDSVLLRSLAECVGSKKHHTQYQDLYQIGSFKLMRRISSSNGKPDVSQHQDHAYDNTHAASTRIQRNRSGRTSAAARMATAASLAGSTAATLASVVAAPGSTVGGGSCRDGDTLLVREVLRGVAGLAPTPDASDADEGGAGGGGGDAATVNRGADQRQQQQQQALRCQQAMVAAAQDVMLGPLLGAGSFGKVYRGSWRGKTVAVKVISHNRRNTPTVIENELQLSLSFNHRNIVRALSYIICAVDADGKPTLSVKARDMVVSGDPQPLPLPPAAPPRPENGDGADGTAAAGAVAAAGDGGMDTLACAEGDGRGGAADFDMFALLCGGDGGTEDAQTEQRDVAETWVVQEFMDQGTLSAFLRHGGMLLRAHASGEAPLLTSLASGELLGPLLQLAAAANATTTTASGPLLAATAAALLATADHSGGPAASGSTDACGNRSSPPEPVPSMDTRPPQLLSPVVPSQRIKSSLSVPLQPLHPLQHRQLHGTRQAPRPPPLGLDMLRVLQCALDVARGLQYMHRLNVCHGDLKPGNILLADDATSPSGLVAKLADFGLSRALASDRTHTITCNHGTVPYMAPEVLGSGRVSPAACIYSYGIILWELVSGRPPYSGMIPGHIIKRVLLEDMRPNFSTVASHLLALYGAYHVHGGPMSSGCGEAGGAGAGTAAAAALAAPLLPEWYQDLACRCWHKEPASRPTADQVVQELEVRVEELVRVRSSPAAAAAGCWQHTRGGSGGGS